MNFPTNPLTGVKQKNTQN